MPSPTFENAMPATYEPYAMPSRAAASDPSLTAFSRLSAMNLMLFHVIISDTGVAPGVMYASIACVSASMPVAAVSPFGMLMSISASLNAIIGMSFGSTQTSLRPASSSVMT